MGEPNIYCKKNSLTGGNVYGKKELRWTKIYTEKGRFGRQNVHYKKQLSWTKYVLEKVI